ncbi:uncharacterized protein LOC119099498 [Pollicipes pollicipes]|uniref:uncharacterized protein LOC119099498 n=1 Tax=Pollicipes pollicipes TaxID=41117 RepID=UPI001884C2FD|nr:uncharacterized protein LOC119099498 [Pollicipes pollicipes]
MQDRRASGERRSSGIFRVQETLVIAVGPTPDLQCWDETGHCRHDGEVTNTGEGAKDPWASDAAQPDGGSLVSAVSAGGDGIQIICRYDTACEIADEVLAEDASPPVHAPPEPPVSPDAVGEFSSIVEIDGDSFFIHSRLVGREEDTEANSGREDHHDQDTDDDEEEADNSEDDERGRQSIVEQCRQFYESRLVAHWPAPEATDTTVDADEREERPTSVDSGRESGTDSQTAELGDVLMKPARSPSPLELKMALLRREVCSLMRQDNELFRQLLALNDSIEALKSGEGSLSPSSSLSSLPDIEEDSISTPSSVVSHQSHLSSDADNCTPAKGDSGSERSFFAEILHVTGITNWVNNRSNKQDSTTANQVASPSLCQTALPSPPMPEKPARRSGHRKQGSCDSGIVDQELRGQA